MRLRWGLSERIPCGPTYRAPYGANNNHKYKYKRHLPGIHMMDSFQTTCEQNIYLLKSVLKGALS